MVELIWNGRELLKRFSGRVSVEDFIEAAYRVQADPRFDDLRAIINDLSACTDAVDPDPSKIDEIAARDSAAALTNPYIRVASVTDHPVIREAMRAYGRSGLSPLPLRVFDTLAQARAWLSGPG